MGKKKFQNNIRPFKNAEEFKPYRDEWFNSKFASFHKSMVKVVHYYMEGVVLCNSASTADDSSFRLCIWDDFFKYFERENGEPCGIKEDV